ncbi:hypothetical protein KAJ61_00540 [Candidatus Parcubacteria bacterium]|nr:hypothetical protein [Candidatus Parcubacteria bacterium]
MAFAKYSDGSTHSADSRIYKWNGALFEEFQSILTNGALDWESFSINDETYLAVANSHDEIFNTESRIYKWDGSSFVNSQSILTNGAYDWESFSIGADTYLAIANLHEEGVYNIDSKIYKWSGSSFVEFQSIPTNGAIDWESFSIDDETYLAVANFYNGVTFNIDSKIYRWNGLEFIKIQDILTNGVYDLESFSINSETYLAIANRRNGNIHSTDSKIYRWNNSLSLFEEIQAILTNGAFAWKSFSINDETYLAMASGYDRNVKSIIYKWNGSSFIQFQAVSMGLPYDWESCVINDKTYLFLSGLYNDLEIYVFSNQPTHQEQLIIQPEEVIEINFNIPENCAQSTVSKIIEGSDVEMSLITPNGDIISRGTIDPTDLNIKYTLTDGNIFEAYYLTNPSSGDWTVVLEGTNVPDSGELTELTIINDIAEENADATPPEITISVSPDTLWPPNHKMILIMPTITVSDNSDPDPIVELKSITINEGEETNTYDAIYDLSVDDGDTPDDIEVDANGNIRLRAERTGTGNGRVYTITYTATDASSNTASSSATVTVPHDCGE